ncbi:F0F1 ATP synthase assembly protein I [Starkeya sp. ORNL1]|uniref:AtpZ/AtpI family protein n=1 Tax=Starkeya sp. ORNL1 TaxID=2709380 RepID=UPI0014646E64|nr:AtpZ/AtpI family protein [Starkeya sp. ORNL1]QJP15240.1 F0F1 ATP synthase assembly protein I [Starkeya sp. ORNL1]
MDDRKPTDGQDGGQPRQATDAELANRLKTLDAAVRKVRSEQQAEDAAAAAGPNKTSATAGMTLAFRLGSEFVAGVLVGAGLGWAIDRVLGTTPWAMIVLLLLGFGAGIMNMMRAAGETGRKKPPQGGA